MRRTASGAAVLIALALAGCEQTGTKKNPSGLYVITQSDRAGYIDAKGEVVIPPQFDKAYGFTEGLAVVQLAAGRAYVDDDGKIVINPQFEEAFDFNGDFAGVGLGGARGYIGPRRQVRLEPVELAAWDPIRSCRTTALF